ncbi:MAG: hypothetical protein WA005_08155, partial [Candidatus Binataceae bacterium]
MAQFVAGTCSLVNSTHRIGGPGASDDQLWAARQELSPQAEALGEARRRLQEEIAERGRIAAERDEAERKLNDSEATLRKIFDATLDMIAVMRLDEAGVDPDQEAFRLHYAAENALGGNASALRDLLLQPPTGLAQRLGLWRQFL